MVKRSVGVEIWMLDLKVGREEGEEMVRSGSSYPSSCCCSPSPFHGRFGSVVWWRARVVFVLAEEKGGMVVVLLILPLGEVVEEEEEDPKMVVPREEPHPSAVLSDGRVLISISISISWWRRRRRRVWKIKKTPGY